ncbi:MAG: sulfatase-like hydrolase/transferase [Anaerolineales bacterium]|nr:sulfatase-like hydrolase/transferase [Anaerolineales bacterium]
MRSNSSKSAIGLPLFFNLAVLAAYFHALMEWLFFVTQSSSLSILSLYEKLKVLFVTGGVISFILIAFLLLLAYPARRWKALGYVPAALMLSITVLVMLDNFTYTLFEIGIVTASGFWRILYAVLLTLIFYWMYKIVRRQRPWSRASLLTLSLLAVSSVAILSIHFSRNASAKGFDLDPLASSSNHPNIIIIGADGLSVRYLSAYGFEEDTTPFLAELMKTSLVAENAYPNSSSTTGSTTSVLTGREPAEVKIYRYPDILSDEDSFKHLPGILKNAGYKTVEIGAPSYVDARKVNIAGGFEIVNGNSTENPLLDSIEPVLGNTPSAYFIQIVVERVSQRLLHIFYIKEMENPFKQVNNPSARLTDAERKDEIIALLAESDRPLFIFSHFMNTHGPHFGSDDESSTTESLNGGEEWDVELYKQSIRNFDDHVREIYTYLEDSGKLDDTILVIYTDHGYRYVVNSRIPLIIRFPNGAHAGSRRNNAQIIDLPVTLLDYLGVKQPEWMTGVSLLNEEPPPLREIISITAGSPKKIKPPFYQIKSVQVIVCQKWYVLNVQDLTWKTGEVTGHTAPCDPSLLPPEDQVRQEIVGYLEHYGYDVGTLK